jgi:hypothetical protein
MATEPWQSLSARLAGRQVGLREGIPEIMEAPLREWILDIGCQGRLRGQADAAGRVSRHARAGAGLIPA